MEIKTKRLVKKTYEEIKSVLLDDEDGCFDYSFQDLGEAYDIDKEKIKEVLGDFDIVVHCGNEDFPEGAPGDGQNQITVYHFKEHDVYVKITGWYSSWDSGEWDSISQTTPTTREVTFY